jgi:hypothetical protein
MVIFHQRILHEIMAGKKPYDQFRLFMGWRLTTSGRLLFDEQKRLAIADLGVPPLPSGQLPAVYSKNHRSGWWNRACAVRGQKIPEETMTTQQWIQASFVPPVLDRLDETGGFYIARAMQSLTDYGMRNGYEYNEEDKAIILHLHAC